MAERNNILPDDILLFHILPRLPATSLGRFMSVCKQWRSFLTTPAFTKMHLHHVNNQNHYKFLVVSTTEPCDYFCTIDRQTPKAGLSAIRSLPFEVGSNVISIISSLNGLVCVGIRPSGPLRFFQRYNYTDIILWNPLTGDYKMLSKGNYLKIPPKAYGLYYSCCDDDYKLLLLTQSNDAYIYSWKSDSWRKAKSRIDPLLKIWEDFGCLQNGKLYFLERGPQGIGSSEWSSLIIRFDTETEMFTEIATPSVNCFRMTVVGGCIHLSVLPKRDGDPLTLWKMDGDGEWTKVICTFPITYLIKEEYRVLPYGHLECNEAKKVCQYTIDDTKLIAQKGKIFVETIVSLKR